MAWISNLFSKSRKRDPTVVGTVPVGSGTTDFVQMLLTGMYPQGLEDSKYAKTDLYSLFLARVCIDKIATEVSKAVPKLQGFDEKLGSNKRMEYFVSKYPNDVQDISQFLYQLTTILLVESNVFILPVYENVRGINMINGFFIAPPEKATIVEIKDTLWVQYTTDDGRLRLFKYSDCGHVKRMQYKQELWGESNLPFARTAALYEENIDRATAMLKSGALPAQFWGKLNVAAQDGVIEKEQKLFKKRSKDGNDSGLILVDNRFEEFKQINKDFKTLLPNDLKILKDQAFDYWGVSEAILQNCYSEDDWNGFYQSRIEPILIQIGNVLTRMLFTKEEIMDGKGVDMQTDRLQYASISSRLNVAFGAYDRGMTTLNDSRSTLNMSPLPGKEGEQRYIRGEYRAEGSANRNGEFGKGGEQDGSGNQKIDSVHSESADG